MFSSYVVSSTSEDDGLEGLGYRTLPNDNLIVDIVQVKILSRKFNSNKSYETLLYVQSGETAVWSMLQTDCRKERFSTKHPTRKNRNYREN